MGSSSKIVHAVSLAHSSISMFTRIFGWQMMSGLRRMKATQARLWIVSGMNGTNTYFQLAVGKCTRRIRLLTHTQSTATPTIHGPLRDEQLAYALSSTPWCG